MQTTHLASRSVFRLLVPWMPMLALCAGCPGDDAAPAGGSSGATTGSTTAVATGTTAVATGTTGAEESGTATAAESTSGTTGPSAVCGDGVVAETEVCDDNNSEDGDGCDATCNPEEGYECTDEPSVCSAVCGDGLIIATELCDDGNTESEDGCSSTCEVEPGYTCGGEPTTCSSLCGDGLLAVGSEACDDHNLDAGDGCDDQCEVESGYTCTGSPSDCTTTCGDGLVAAPAEACDDMNTEALDGCSDTCEEEAGYACTGEPSDCVSSCGDSIIAVGDEICDSAEVAGVTCADQLFTGGVLTCDGTCNGYDTAGCFNGGQNPTNANNCAGGSVICGNAAFDVLECVTTTLTPPITVYEVNLSLTDGGGTPYPTAGEVLVFEYGGGPPNGMPTTELAAEPADTAQLSTGSINHVLATPVVVPNDSQSFCIGLRSFQDFAVVMSSNDNGNDTTFLLRDTCLVGTGWEEFSNLGLDGHWCADALVNGSPSLGGG